MKSNNNKNTTSVFHNSNSTFISNSNSPTNTNTPHSLHDYKKSTNHTIHSPTLRIVDILNDDVVPVSMERLHCSSPHRIVSRWLSWLKRVKTIKSRRVRIAKREVGNPESDPTVQVNPSSCVIDAGDDSVVSDSSCRRSDAGRRRNEGSFNVGVGCCLLYLIAASKNEIDKMVEIRMQMEMILRDVKEELQKKNTVSNTSDENTMSAYSTTDDTEDSYFENQLLSPLELTLSSDFPESSTITMSDRPFKSETPKVRCLGGMDQLEAELEVELERLQLHFDTGDFSRFPSLRVPEGNVTSSMTASDDVGEVVDDLQADIATDDLEMSCAVPARELERKLHELLEARQQGQIKELESALERLSHKLHEKEMEVSWWKDTAKVISQRVTEYSLCTSEHSPAGHQLSR